MTLMLSKRGRLIGLILLGLLIIAGSLFYSISHVAAPAAKPGLPARTSNAVTPQAAENKPQATENRQAVPASFDTARLSHTDPASLWVVVNKQHPLAPKSYAPSDLQAVGGGQQMRTAAAAALSSMFAASRQAGLTLSAASAYRSYDTQVTVYNKEVADYGQATADSESARPGYSEHQTGLAVDIAGGGCSIEDCFGTTAEGKWAAANAYIYGYILRYTEANSTTTGYRAESWHFRYVGTELAAHMHDSGVSTLEEIFNVSGGPNY